MKQWRQDLGISSIAWEPTDDLAIAEALMSKSIINVDLAPTKYFGWTDPEAISKAKEIRKFWNASGISIRGMQSLLFGTQQPSIFNRNDWRFLVNHFKRVADISEALGSTKLVFGSPQNRRLGTLDMSQGIDIAQEFFFNLGENLSSQGQTLLIEPNPRQYNCDFITTTVEAIDFVKTIGLANVRVQLDLGTCYFNQEDPIALVTENEKWLGYVHLAAEHLLPLHSAPNATLKTFIRNYEGTLPISIEQKTDISEKVPYVTKAIDWIDNC